MAKRRTVPLRREWIEPQACTLQMRRQILKALPFFRTLGEQEIVRIDGSFRDKGFEPEEVIVAAGQVADRLSVVARGKLVVLRSMPSGKEVLLEVLSRGDFFGSLLPSERAPSADVVRAQTAGCLLTVSALQFQQILENHPRVALAVLEIVGKRLRRAQEMIQHLSASSAEVRIAHTLVRLAEKLGTPGTGGVLIQVPLSREDLAAMTGTTSETVSRLLSRLRRAGLIETGRRWVRVRDLEALSRLAEPDQAPKRSS
jgi:CRP-like cAMP-binding protein